MASHRLKLFEAACLCCVWFSAVAGVGQTVAPPIAEYRGAARGMFELRNDGDAPLAVIVELHGFSVDEEGSIRYEDLDPRIKAEIGASSFVIPPHGSHLVFYKAQTDKPNAWFTILSTLTMAASDQNRMRINFVLPHVVYLYQRQKLKKDDIGLAVLPGKTAGEYSLEIKNLSTKLGRVESVSWRGCETNGESGGFPAFPLTTRRIHLETGEPSANASVKVRFQDGFSVQMPVK